MEKSPKYWERGTGKEGEVCFTITERHSWCHKLSPLEGGSARCGPDSHGCGRADPAAVPRRTGQGGRKLVAVDAAPHNSDNPLGD